MLGCVSGGFFGPAWPPRAGPGKEDHSPCWGMLLANTLRAAPPLRDGVPSKASSALHPRSRECWVHASPPCASHSLISLLSISPPFPLGRPDFLVTFGILLNTCDLWPLPSGLPTHLSPQLLPLLNSVRLAPPPVIKRRTFQVDPFPLPRPPVASLGLRESLGLRGQRGLQTKTEPHSLLVKLN